MLTEPKKIPTSAGVYIFRHDKTPLYIGKAANLKLRLASYFRNQTALPFKIQKMLREATRLEMIETESEIEALIKEAELIKKYRPKYNSLMRDDKNYFFVGITKEDFPRIFTTHQPDKDWKVKLQTTNARYFGPFTSVAEVKTVLKLLRHVFPYCTCKGVHKRPCLNSQIGRCPRYCCTAGFKIQDSRFKKARRAYQRNIRNIVAVLTGKRQMLLQTLKHHMRTAAKAERYEEAGRLRDQIAGLEGVFSHRSVLQAPLETRAWSAILPKLQLIFRTTAPIHRIEGYDISNISGTEATGSMVVFADGVPDKSQYRKFRIKTVRDSNDVAMLREVLRRRFSHSEWPFPELVVIDGGKPQLNTALKAIHDSRFTIHDSRLNVTALAKREEVLFTESGRAIYLQRGDPAILHLFQRIRDESHRFARAYHHKLRKKHFANSAGQ
ncbi:MAG: hypothetical protein A3B37_03410 [Candidatus Sungbacteria bacterium RIFCSPLOWO2_01_FULL_59_16]|uniref:Excinuclease ABC subunit C n=1 Tax=Candidatus Sungbacteria bacterium RIFCSPLOWO2_01_FULL_59_16 TaxID=1802280 RepID=A0A1G2LCF8_9BACT|nr:MAG: hypothetical protein A3B37_03410 [Candidatus Sungbacteria bacterium RIFCSPLOWO2_01_FULL_59_16]